MNTDMKKETAVEYMFRLLDVLTFGKDNETQDIFNDILEKAKAMEKEQIEENMAKAITFGWELSHYHRDKEPEVLLQMQKDFITSVIEGGDK
jgi:hypothetical protein